MQKFLLLISFHFLTLCSRTQTIAGTYIGLELNGLTIDSAGQVYFYGFDTFPKQKWFYEVKIIIKSNHITVDKSPVYFDSLGKTYSASDGGFITYGGTFFKSGDVYIAKTKMTAYDYMGFSFFEPPKIADDIDSSTIKMGKELPIKQTDQDLLEKYDRIKKEGMFVYFPKGTLRQDYILRYDKKGIWLNNVFYNRATKKQSP
jgi:hypothetical protein